MSKISEERLDQMLTSLCKAEPEQPFVYRPQEDERPAVVPFYRRYCGLAAAAVLVFISVVSLTVFFLFGNKPTAPVPVAPVPHGTAPSEPGTAGSDAPTDSRRSPPSTIVSGFSAVTRVALLTVTLQDASSVLPPAIIVTLIVA